jgi:hypothetical protein
MLTNPLVQGSLVRLSYGVLSEHFPSRLIKGLGLTEATIGDQGRYFNRLVGGREVLIGLSSIAAVKRGQGDFVLKANVMLGLADAVAIVHEVNERGRVDATLVRGIAFNLLGWMFVARAVKAAQAAQAADAAEAAPGPAVSAPAV